MSRPRTRLAIEDAADIDLRKLLRDGWLAQGKHEGLIRHVRSGTCVTGCFTAEIGADRGVLAVSMPPIGEARRHLDCTIHLEAKPQPFGGHIWFMRCPVSGRSARRLFLFAGDNSFRCRESIHPTPTYLSSRMSGLNRALEQINAMRREHGVPALLWPNKPFGKGTRTFARRFLVREIKVWAEAYKILTRRYPARDI